MPTSPRSLAEILRENLEGVEKPEGYDELRQTLARNRPKKPPLQVSESPENEKWAQAKSCA